MEKNRFQLRQIVNRNNLLIIMIILLGFCLRIAGITWGGWAIFQPDEGKMVRVIKTMVDNHTIFNSVFTYPAQTGTKIASILLCIYYKLGGIKTDAMLERYWAYRVVVVVFSTITIWMAYLIGNKIRKNLGIVFAILVCVFPEFVNNSKQVTGDSIVMCLCSVIMLLSMYYLDTEHTYILCIMGLCVAAATMEKWHGAVACFYIAFIVIYKHFHAITKIIWHGMISFVSYIVGVLIISPNIIWQFSNALDGFLFMKDFEEDHIPFLDRLNTYIHYPKMFSGVIFLGLIIIGVYFTIKYWNPYLVVLTMGAIKLVCIVFVNRAFPRWCHEFYFCLLLVCSYGIICAYNDWGRLKGIKFCVSACYMFAAITFLVVSVFFAVLACATKNDTRTIQLQYCRDNGIDGYNTINENYTAFSPGGDSEITDSYYRDKYNNIEAYLLWQGDKLYSNTDEKVEYMIMLANSPVAEETSTWIQENCVKVAEFNVVAGDNFRPYTCISGKAYTEIGIMMEYISKIKEVCDGGYIGKNIVIYRTDRLESAGSD